MILTKLLGCNLNLNQINVLNILFMVNEIFTGDSGSVEVNKEGNFEIFKEKLDKEKQESNEQLDTGDKLESEESATKRRNQQGQGLKILTPDQILSRLPITLAQLKAGNNSQKLNEIRQLLYSLYRSKKLTKQLYKSLVDII